MLKLCHIGITYYSESGETEALRDINISINDGEFVSILGPSGCGKSTMLFIAAGLTKPKSGTVYIDNKSITEPYHEVGFVFQDHLLLEWRKAIQNVSIQGELRGMGKNESLKKARKLLEMVGLRDFANKYPFELSGGMQQRVSLCRALLHEPKILLMDEPFGALDALTREQMRSDLQNLVIVLKNTVMFVTHDISEAILLSDRVIVLTKSPGTVLMDLKIDLPRPRSMSISEDSKFLAYKKQLTQLFMSMGVLNERIL